jgi:hypothetical protein
MLIKSKIEMLFAEWFIAQKKTSKQQAMMKSIVEQTRELPPGVIGNVLTFIPRNDTAQLMVDANKKEKLVLKYVRKHKIEEGVYKDELFSTLAPSVTWSNMYGDEDSDMKIIRSRISKAEKIRMRTNALRNNLVSGWWVSTVATTLTYDSDEEDGFIEFE